MSNTTCACGGGLLVVCGAVLCAPMLLARLVFCGDVGVIVGVGSGGFYRRGMPRSNSTGTKFYSS